MFSKTYGIKIRLDKCYWFQSEIIFLGNLVDKYGIRINPKYRQKLLQINKPTNAKALQRYLGAINYISRFIPNLYLITAPLYKLLQKNVKFEWKSIHDKCYNKLLHIIHNTPFLKHPDFDLPFILIADASHVGIGGVLAQYHNQQLCAIDFASKLFNNTQQNWAPAEQEIYAIIYFCERWKPYLINKPFEIYTDHKNLVNLFNNASYFKSGKLFRWAIRIQELSFTLKYIKGSRNLLADWLSRDVHTLDDNTFI